MQLSSKYYSALAVALICSCIALAGAGCSLFSPGAASFASVTIKGHTTGEIANVTGKVFREDGYSGGFMGGSQMTFEKEGSRMDNLAYQGVVSSHYGAQTLVRVKTEIVALKGDSRRLQCKAYMVRNSGDSFFEKEQPLANIRSGPYQSLLDAVARQLK